MHSFLKKFKRVTYSTSYLPEIDGLRFLAIFSVVVILHITGYMNERFYNGQFVSTDYWKNIMTSGGAGVSLFFMISGFILSLPFAKWRLNNGKRVSLKNYYLRRVTRLEPPYVIALIIFFIANVWVINKYSFNELLPHFFASVFYLHTIIFRSFSLVLPVAWSLEVEVQFYILAPLFFSIFLIKSKWIRWIISLLIILSGSIYWFDVWELPHVFRFLHFFFGGILLADFYCSNVMLIKNQSAGFIIGIASLAGFIFSPAIDNMPGYFLKIACMFLLFHIVLTNIQMKKIFSVEPIIIIGGMCYSIYLLHFAIISLTGQLLLKSGIDVTSKVFFIPFAIGLAALVLFLSSIYFLLIEKPFMKPMLFKKR